SINSPRISSTIRASFLHRGAQPRIDHGIAQERTTLRIRPRLTLVLTSIVLVILAVGSPAHAQILRPISGPGAQAQNSGQTTAAPPANQYVGESTCITCHDQKYTGTAHALKSNERTPAANMGCESCHGPGKAHVDAGGDPS